MSMLLLEQRITFNYFLVFRQIQRNQWISENFTFSILSAFLLYLLKLIFIGVQLRYNVVLVSIIQQSESAIHIQISPLLWDFLPIQVKHMERCSTSLIIREMQIKLQGTTSHSSKWPSLKKSTNNECWRGYGDKGTLLHSWWEDRLYNHYGNQYGVPLKN